MTEETSPTLLDRVTAWVGTDPDLTVDENGNLIVVGDPPTTIEMTETTDGLVLTHLGSGGGPLPARGSRVRVHHGDDGTVALSATAYADGFSRQAFADAVSALVEAVSTASGPGAAPDAEPTMPKPVAEPEPTREMPAAWVPTHAVPAAGTRAWANPDPGPDPIATLEPRVRLAVAERRGDWARVVGSNGWTGWVDARVLEPVAAEPKPAPPPGRPAGLMSLKVIPLAGGVAIALSALFPWITGSNPKDIPAAVLWDSGVAVRGSDNGFAVLWILLGLAVLALIAAVVRMPRVVTALAGLLAVAVAVLFAVQIYRAVSDLGGSFSDFTEIMKLTPFLAVAGGILLMAGRPRE
jgi:hypothetical protein